MKDEGIASDGKSPRDWLEFLSGQTGKGMPEIDLRHLAEGDVLMVHTVNSRYAFLWHKDGSAEVASNRGKKRPSGQVRVNGCTFGKSSSIKPGVLFCGGNLEYVSRGGSMTHTTTTIRSLELLRRTSISALAPS